VAEEEANEEPKPKSPWMLAFAVGLAGALVGGGVAFIAISKAPSGGGQVVEEEVVTATFSERVHSLDPFVVNVSGEAYPRYVKLSLAFEMNSPEAKEELVERIAQIRDLTILMLSTKRLSDIEDFEGKALLKDDLRERINAVLEDGKVESVLFTEFVVQ